MNFEFFSKGIKKILEQAGAEFIFFDQEHSEVSYDQLKFLSQNSENLLTLTRVPQLEYNLIARSLDVGVQGIMCPKIETREQAEKLVEYSKYRPLGKRGLAFGISHDKYQRKIDSKSNYMFKTISEKMNFLNENIITIALIETELGIKNCEEIMAVPGIDVGWFGHYDLTDSMKIVGEFDNEKFLLAIEKFISACKKNNKPAGIIDTNLKYLKKMKEKGFTMIGYGHDVAIFQEAYYEGINKLK